MKTNYKIEGTPNSPVLVFSNSLGSDLGMWEELVPYLLPYFRVLRYDTRGHGGSQVTAGEYSIAQLGRDVLDLLNQLNIEKVYFCGLSMGGLIGQWLGIHHPERLNKLVISNTDAKIGDADRWNDRIKIISEKGMESIIETTLEKWFTDAFRQENPDKVQKTKSVFLANDPVGYCGCCAAIRDADFRKDLQNITLETLVITGDEDEVTNVVQAKTLADGIVNSQLKLFPARHLASTELPEQYAQTLIHFIIGDTVFDRGMHVRRTVLGGIHVDASIKNKNEFNGDFQEFISHYAWGEIWTRPGLTKHNRSLITLSMLIALNRKAEFKMHVRAAVNNGVGVYEIKEVIMQSGIYCGLPAANEALHSAQEVLEELGIEF